MSSTRQAISSTENVKLVIDALADYAKETGKDLSCHPFADKFQQSNSPEDILQLLEEREKAFKEYREGNRRLISSLKPVVKVFHAFSGVLAEATSLIPFPPASALFVGIDTLLGAARDVSSSYDALSDLFEHLGSFVKRLDIYMKIDLTPIMRDIIVKIMIELLSVLSLATKQITQKRFMKFAKKLLGETEIEDILQRLDRLSLDEARIGVAETLGVVHGLVGNVKEIMEDREASMDSIRQDLGALHRELIEINKTRRDQLQRDAKDWLSPPDPSTNHIFVSDARHSGTAAWFFKSEKLKEWNARGSLLWVRGKPGAGKSTLLSAIIEDIEGKHAIGLAKMAYYYFDFRDDKKQDRHGLLSSLILQLSSESDSCCSILSKLYSSNNHARKPTVIALKKCVKDMLSLPGQGPVYILVDALDECSNSSGMPSARREVMDLIKELVGLKRPNVYLCVASRPEIDIRMVLEPLEPLHVSLDDEMGQKADIIAYIEHTVHSNSPPEWTEKDQELVIHTLSQKEHGMFRYVTCQMENVLRCYSNDIQGTLDDLPEDLDDTYERTLRDIDKQKRKYAQRLLQCISVSIRPLRLDELADIFAVQFDGTASNLFAKNSRPRNIEWAVLSACSSLVTIIDQGGSRVVQFSHFSVKEFLTSERLAQAEEHISFYHILPEPAHTLLALGSLTVLLQLDDKIDKDTIGDFPLAPYAARHWVIHAKFRSVSSRVQEAMERLFDPTKTHFAAWVWLYDIDRHWTEPMSTIHPTCPEAAPLYYASLCGFRGLVEHLITAYSSDVNSRGGSNTTPLHAAAAKGNLEVASLLLKSGANPNSRDIAGRVPLHRVSQGGQNVMMEPSLEIARLLLNSGANINFAADDDDETPLHAAARSGRCDIAELLIDSGASLDAGNYYKQTPLQVACRNGKLDVSRFLLGRGSNVNSRNTWDQTPLHTASESGHVEAVRVLLDYGSDVNAQCTESWTPLHRASRYGHLDVARLLIDHNANVNAQCTESWTPLHHASRYGRLDVARLLIDHGANVNKQDKDLWTPIHLASSNGHLDTIKLLVGQGVHVDGRNGKEETPLNVAAQHGFLDIARFLIESGATVSARDNKGWTAFHMASDCGHLHIVKFLLECGVEVNIRNGSGESSLDLASGEGEIDVVRFLIKHGADINVKADDGSSALHTASKNGHLDVVRLLIDTGIPFDIRNRAQETPLALASGKGNVEVGRFLIEQGANINVQDNESQVPLHSASANGRLEMAQLLLDHGIDPNIQKGDLWSPLHLASANSHLNVAELLIQRGARIDIFNDKQETPLYQAVKNGEVPIACLLIDNGANLYTVDGNGWTLLHAASHSGHLGVVELLLRRGADVDVLNMANLTAAELASENGKAGVAKFIADYKADPNTRITILSNSLDSGLDGADENETDMEKTSLHAAAEEGNIEVVRLLLERGVDVNGRNADDETPLNIAAAQGNLDVVRLLIGWGAEVDSPDQWGWTPLHTASRFGHLEVARALLDHGAIVNSRTQDHWTPMHLSAYNRHLDLVKLLLGHGADVHAVDGQGDTPYQLLLQGGHRELADLLRNHGAGRGARESPW